MGILSGRNLLWGREGKREEKRWKDVQKRNVDAAGEMASDGSDIFQKCEHYSAQVIRKCDLSSLLKASLKLPNTFGKTDDRVIRDGAYT